MKKRVLLFFFAILPIATSASPASAQSVTFKMLKTPDAPWFNYSLSANGKVMAANLGGEIYRWTAKTGFVDLGPSDPLNTSIGISGDGSTITTTIIGQDGNTNAGVWREATGWISLGHIKHGCVMDQNWGSGYSVNGDGSMIVGLAWYCPGAQGFVWTWEKGMLPLSHPAHAGSRATAVSNNSSTIVGFFEHPTQGFRRPVFWRNGKKSLFAGRNTPGEATAVSSDGSVIVGQAADASGYPRTFYYTDTNGLVSLGTISGNDTDQSIANGVSDQGIVIGWSGDPFWGGITPFFWDARTPSTPMVSLQDALTARGAKIPKNVILTNALTISADGSTIVGTWMDSNFNQGTWMARFK